MDRLAEHLGSMQKLGTHSAAQYVLSLSSSLLVSAFFRLPLLFQSSLPSVLDPSTDDGVVQNDS